MVETLKVGIYIVAILFLLVLLLRIFSKGKKTVSAIFVLTLFLLLGSYLIMMIFELVDYFDLIQNYLVLYTMVAFAYALSGFGGLTWLLYVLSLINYKKIDRRLEMSLAFVPVFLLGVVLVVNCFNGFIFSFNNNGDMIIGPGFRILDLLIFSYIISTFVQCLFVVFDKKEYLNKNRFGRYAFNISIPIVGEVIQIIYPAFEFEVLLVVFAMLLVYLDIKHSYISRDAQTNLYNKSNLLVFLDTKIKHYDPRHPFYFMIFDIDHFKKINDNFGHVEGDNALVRLAAILDELRNDYQIYVSRFGGDEFGIVINGDDEGFVKELYRKINDLLYSKNKEDKTQYNIHVSAGYIKFDPKFSDANELIKAADEEMYKEKKRKELL